MRTRSKSYVPRECSYRSLTLTRKRRYFKASSAPTAPGAPGGLTVNTQSVVRRPGKPRGGAAAVLPQMDLLLCLPSHLAARGPSAERPPARGRSSSRERSEWTDRTWTEEEGDGSELRQTETRLKQDSHRLVWIHRLHGLQ